jgi:hypothetical protein
VALTGLFLFTFPSAVPTSEDLQPSLHWSVEPKSVYTWALDHFNPEDAGTIRNTAHIHMVQRPKRRININSEPL